MSVRDDILTALVAGLTNLPNDPDFDCPDIADVVRFWPMLDELNDHRFPLIVVDENGNRPGPEHAGIRRFTTFVNVNCIVRTHTDEIELATDAENVASGVLKYLHSDPSLHSQVLDVMVVESEDHGAYSTVSAHHYNIMHRIRIIWHDTVQDVTSSSDTDVYGSQWLDDARDKLITRLTTLKTTMASGYMPTFGYLYHRHRIPDLQLNAVSVGIKDVTQDHFSDDASGASIQYYLRFGVRVHTAYLDEIADDQEVGRLVNSIVNQLRAQINLADGFHIFEISGINTDASFEESESRGGEFDVVVGIAVRHTQE